MHTEPLYDPSDKYLPSSENYIVETSNTEDISAAGRRVPIPNIKMVVRSMSFSCEPN